MERALDLKIEEFVPSLTLQHSWKFLSLIYKVGTISSIIVIHIKALSHLQSAL